MTDSSWRPMAPSPLSPREGHAGVWTGEEMIIWGGKEAAWNTYCVDGARYDPKRDQWTPISTEGAPSARSDCAGVWTGRELAVWGGLNGETFTLADGALYDPKTDAWRPIPPFEVGGKELGRHLPGMVWTGAELLVWGGAGEETAVAAGGVHDPETGEWRAISSKGEPDRRQNHCALWTGERLLVWGGQVKSRAGGDQTGSIYDPAQDCWTPIAREGAPKPRVGFAAVWTGKELLVWGGFKGGKVYNGDGGLYDPGTQTWRPIKRTKQAPGKRTRPAGVWTGSELLIWGGAMDGNLADGAHYDPATGKWRPMPEGPLEPRFRHTALWTGEELLIWGGLRDQNSLHSSGAVYRP